jgi:two-component system, response regulator
MTHDEVQILYVEDDPADAELTLEAMRQSKMANTIHIARDGVEALDFLFCRGPHASREFMNLKFVLLDLKLPKVSGLEVLRAIRSDRRTELVPVVVLTSSKEQRDIIDSYQLRVNSYVQKPVDFDKFQQIVQQLGFYWLIVNQSPVGVRTEARAAGAAASR